MSESSNSRRVESPRHGQERNYRQEVRIGERVELIGANVGRFSMPASMSSTPVSERWCASCAEWKPQRGILAVVLGCPDCKREWR